MNGKEAESDESYQQRIPQPLAVRPVELRAIRCARGVQSTDRDRLHHGYDRESQNRRWFAPLWAPELETTVQAPACSATNESSQPAFQTRLTAEKPRQRSSSTATQKWPEMAVFRGPNGQIIVRLYDLKTSGSMVYEQVLLRMERHFGHRRPFPRKPRFPPVVVKSH